VSLPEVVTVGEAMVLLYSADASTPLGKVRQLTMDVGGADSNFAIAMTRLGFRAGWVSRVGASPLGEVVVRTIADEGVDVSQVASDQDHPTGVYFKYHVGEHETRVIYYRSASAASRLQPEDLDPGYFAQARLLHLNGMTCALGEGCERTVREALRLAKTVGAVASLDLNLRLQLWSVDAARRSIISLLPQVNVLFGTEDEFRILFDRPSLREALQAASRLGPETVVAKCGERGAAALVSETLILHGGFSPPDFVDSVGAGDGFNAGFMAARLRGMTPGEALRLGNLVGAAAVAVPGDFQGYPTWSELETMASTWPEKAAAVG
jgi:2-dehydro-3-deoxygluconokinase